jgi:protein-L-isoaspartate(D-aspartate) O-methyltransferase
MDTEKHQGKRRLLLAELAEKGIKDKKVLEAMMKVPRHVFLDSSFESFAYQDQAFPIAAGQTISHPYTVAFQTEQLCLQAGEKVLEIGTGSGYQTAVLCHMGVKVFTIERQWELFNFSRNMLMQLGLRYIGKFGDGYQGLPTYAPFDKIIITAGTEKIPNELLKQLKVGGQMIVPVGSVEQKMLLIDKKSDKDFSAKELGTFKFVPMLANKE